MSLDRAHTEDAELTHVKELEAHFRKFERPLASHRVGLEHEKLLAPAGTVAAVPYDGPRGVGALLQRLIQLGHTPFRESPDSPVIALLRDQSTISLEPGGQLELSGTAFATARECHQENLRHLEEVNGAASALSLRLLALGYRPFGEVSQMPWMPKSRYQVMRTSLGGRGALALDMMLMTATGQVSLDWESEADCATKVDLVARLTPLLVALYANSPLRHGRPAGAMSFRSRVWTQVDSSRCGFLPSMIDGSFSYRAYVEWALDAPLLFLRREGRYLTPKLTFRQLLAQGYEGRPARRSDWIDHLSTLFPEVRIKGVIEVRSADCVDAAKTGALAALWRGLLYDPAARDEAARLVPRLSFEDHLTFHRDCGTHGLRAELKGRPVQPLAVELVGIARRGLRRLLGDDAPLLDPLAEVAESGRSPAEQVLEAVAGGGDPAAALERFAP